MATSLLDDVKHQDWAEPRVTPVDDPLKTRRQWLLLGVVNFVLLGAFLLFLVDDYVLPSVIAAN
jgi:hypothetical protein